MDDISKAFSGLTPEDLIRDTSSVGEEALISGGAVGRPQFDQWVNDAIKALHLTAGIAAPPSTLGFSMLQNPQLLRHFTVEADETGPMYAARMQREARTMKATWFFNVLTAPGAAYESNATPIPVDHEDIEAIRAALEKGRLKMSLCWYAEMLEPDGSSSQRAGIIPVDSNGRTGEGIEGAIDPEKNLFGGVLSAE